MSKIESLEDVQVKQRIAKCWPKANKEVIKKSKLTIQVTGVIDINPSQLSAVTFTPLQDHLFHQMNNYRDMVFCNRSLSNAKEIRNAYALHALNHITK